MSIINYIKCPTCGSELVNIVQEDKLTTFYYNCTHKVGLVVSNEVRQRTIDLQIEKYVNKELGTLYEELAKLEQTNSPQKFAKKIDFRERGKKIVEYFHSELHDKICIESKICSKISSIDKLTIPTKVALVAQIITSLAGVSIPWYFPSVLLATIIVKDGLSKFCQCT